MGIIIEIIIINNIAGIIIICESLFCCTEMSLCHCGCATLHKSLQCAAHRVPNMFVFFFSEFCYVYVEQSSIKCGVSSQRNLCHFFSSFDYNGSFSRLLVFSSKLEFPALLKMIIKMIIGAFVGLCLYLCLCPG